MFGLMMDKLRDAMGEAVYISSWNRCKTHNKEVGGSSTSGHLDGTSADVTIKSPIYGYELLSLAIEIGFTRIGIHLNTRGKGFIHLEYDPNRNSKLWGYL